LTAGREVSPVLGAGVPAVKQWQAISRTYSRLRYGG
jgi:hypothetical protein